MKRICLLVLIVFVQFSVFSQKSGSKDKAAISNQVESLRKAMIDADGVKLKALTSDKLSYVHSNGNFQNQAEFIDGIVSGKSDFVTIEFQNQTITIQNGVAIVSHVLSAHTKDDGIDKDIKIGIMLVWQKQKNNWILIARQAYKLTT
ncbi:nuclear transport factor 2 family protein [Flavobacterium psychroterrae]|jgi:ketosteroid isomerase-like protein|uniref:Nuclear transport factor 2 family protein n=1 Tax=Flavobacterium psychroterrae TaxID=2133767 RepID=A0ABS5P8J8_9FLAO|nr:nuclear transport factor 2 family protein [Flavobacterium psychroterrae]MBS7230140.1 nuclear transport factor 2 family protein [Flavobacterium psychroterrae]